jgi:hypothetical protein
MLFPCLVQNLVRKALYYNYEYYRDLGEHAFKNDEGILHLHVCEYCPDRSSRPWAPECLLTLSLW